MLNIPPKVEHIISIDSNMLKNFLPFIQNPPFTNYSYILPYRKFIIYYDSLQIFYLSVVQLAYNKDKGYPMDSLS